MIKFGNTFLNFGGTYLTGYTKNIDPYNPLDLPPYTIRLKYKQGTTPEFSKGTGIQVSQSPNIWDLTYENSNWNELLYLHVDLLEVLGANTTGVTDMHWMLGNCYSLTTVPLFDTSNVTDMGAMLIDCQSLTSVPLFDTSNVTDMWIMLGDCYSLTSVPLFDTSKVTNMDEMFWRCKSLTSVPLFNTSNVTKMNSMFHECESLTTITLFDTSKVTTMDNMFNDCTNVVSGALAFYQQASTQVNTPSHDNTFTNCGINTQTGAAELAQIPNDWK